MSYHKTCFRKVKKAKQNKNTRIKIEIGLIIFIFILSSVFALLFHFKNKSNVTTIESVKSNEKEFTEIETMETKTIILKYTAQNYFHLGTDSTFNNKALNQLLGDFETMFSVVLGDDEKNFFKGFRDFGSQKVVLESHMKNIEQNVFGISEYLIYTAFASMIRYISLYKTYITRVEELRNTIEDFHDKIVFFDYRFGFSLIYDLISIKKKFNKIISSLLETRIEVLISNKASNSMVTFISSIYDLLFEAIFEKVSAENEVGGDLETREGYYIKQNYDSLDKYLNQNLILILLLLFELNEKGEIIGYESMFKDSMNKLKETDSSLYIEIDKALKNNWKDLYEDMMGNNKKENDGKNISGESINNILNIYDKHFHSIYFRKEGLF